VFFWERHGDEESEFHSDDYVMDVGSHLFPPSTPSTSAGLLFYDTGGLGFWLRHRSILPFHVEVNVTQWSFTTPPCDCPTPLRRQISTIPELPYYLTSSLFTRIATSSLPLSNHSRTLFLFGSVLKILEPSLSSP
jgi:hypothetical protein